MDSQNKKTCSNCGTVNSADFSYCKNCGTPLYWQEQTFGQSQLEFAQPQKHQNAFYENNGVDAKTMEIFVGKNADTYLSKFTTMKIMNKKVSWHWPVFVLGVLLGPVGIAFWAFYRKMYKLAFLFLAIGFLLTACDVWASFFYPLGVVIRQYGNEIFTPDALNEFLIVEIAQKFVQSTHFLSSIVYLLNWATILLASMFAFRIYEKFAIKHIKSIKVLSHDEFPVEHYIKCKGGTSTLAAVLSPIIYYSFVFFVLIAITIISIIL